MIIPRLWDWVLERLSLIAVHLSSFCGGIRYAMQVSAGRDVHITFFSWKSPRESNEILPLMSEASTAIKDSSPLFSIHSQRATLQGFVNGINLSVGHRPQHAFSDWVSLRDVIEKERLFAFPKILPSWMSAKGLKFQFADWVQFLFLHSMTERRHFCTIQVQRYHGHLGLKYPRNIHGNIHAKKCIYSRILWSMAHGYSIDTWISIYKYLIDGLFGLDISWTLQPGIATYKFQCQAFILNFCDQDFLNTSSLMP